MPFMFENLEVYQKTIDLANQRLIATSEFPRGFYFLSDQLNRACVSIAAGMLHKAATVGRAKDWM
jgi:hypothetical protein